MPLLVVERGNDKGLTLKVEPGKAYVVGRDNPQAAAKLTDPMASRNHFQISGNNGSFKLKDMKSRNGTMLNDEKLSPDADVDLKVGDKIQVGETIFSFLNDQKEETPGGGLVGKTIGGYTLQERIGRGGMGTVYKAEQVSLKRVVALKVLSAKLLSDPVFVERFVQEARAAGGLNHPNIVQVFDVGSDRGVYYFSMELMEHGSVGDIVSKDGPIPWQRALEMLTDASKGLIFAEKRGVVHRDIKPDNLMLTEEGTVKIGDLGLAKKSSELGGEGGQIFGTPHFIAPEQAQGKSIDNRADIYALGASFYRVLTGKTPFSGENVKEILLKQIQEEPKPIKEFVKDVPDELTAVLRKMMQKKPDDRYRSAQGLFEDLETIRVRYHLEAHGQAASARRSKVLAILAVIVAIALGGATWHFMNKPAEERWRDRPVDPNPVPNNTQLPDPAKVLADEARNALTDVKEDYNKLISRLKGLGPADTWKDHEPAWEAIAKKFEALATGKYATTPIAAESKRRAAEIRSEIAEAKEKERLRQEEADAAWTLLLQETDKLVKDGRPADAIVQLLDRAASLATTWSGYLKTPEKTAQARSTEIADAAVAAVEPLIKAMQEAAPRFPGTDYLEARRAVEGVRAGLVPQVPGKDANSARLKDLADRAGAEVRSTMTAAREAAKAAIAADELDLFKTYLRMRRWAPEKGPAPADNLFFDYRWDDALKAWNDLLGRLKIEAFRERVRGKIAHYTRCKRLFETVAAKIRSKELKDFTFPESIREKSNMLLDTKAEKLAAASAEGVWVLKVTSGARESVFVRFRDMTPREFHESILKNGQGLPFSNEDRVDLAVFLMEAGEGEAAFAEILPLKSGNAAIEKAVDDWLMGEYMIWAEHGGKGSLRDKYDQYRTLLDAAKKGAQRWDQVDAARRELERVIHDFLGRGRSDRAVASDYFLLQFSNGGPDGPLPRTLLPIRVTQEIVQRLGTAVDSGAPPEEEKPPEETPAPPEKPPEKPPEETPKEPTGGEAPKQDGTPPSGGTTPSGPPEKPK